MWQSDSEVGVCCKRARGVSGPVRRVIGLEDCRRRTRSRFCESTSFCGRQAGMLVAVTHALNPVVLNPHTEPEFQIMTTVVRSCTERASHSCQVSFGPELH